MTEIEQAWIDDIVRELDRRSPRGGARVRLDQYGGGPNEGRIVANQAGFLRFGIELLKAGLVIYEPEKPQRIPVSVDLKYLITDDSVIRFDEFIRDDTTPGALVPSRTPFTRTHVLLGIGCVAVFVLALIGLGALIRWLL